MEATRFSPEVLRCLRQSRRDNRGRPWTLRAATERMASHYQHTMTPEQLRRYEAGESAPDANRVAWLADLYDVPVGTLFCRGATSLTDAETRGLLIARKVLRAT